MSISSRALFASAFALAAAVVAGCSSAEPAPYPTCNAFEPIFAPRPLDSAPNLHLPFQFEGEDVYYAASQGIYELGVNGPTMVAPMPPDVLTRADGTTVDFQTNLSAFWIEPTRFIAVGFDAVFAIPRDGSAPTQLTKFPYYIEGSPPVVTKDDQYVYAAVSGATGHHLMAAPLAGGPAVDLATIVDGSSGYALTLVADASSLYFEHGSLEEGHVIDVFSKDGTPKGSLPVAARANVIGFAGGAFYIQGLRDGSTSTPEIVRMTIDGRSTTTVAVPGDLPFLEEELSAGTDGTAYLWGIVYPADGGHATSLAFLRVGAQASAASPVACQPAQEPFVLGMGVSEKSIYAAIFDDYAWSIVRFPR